MKNKNLLILLFTFLIPTLIISNHLLIKNLSSEVSTINSSNNDIYPSNSDNNQNNKDNNSDNTNSNPINTSNEEVETTGMESFNNQTTYKSISMDLYKSNLNTVNYIINPGDTLSKIIRSYEATCNYKSAINLIKLFNKDLNLDSIEIGDTLILPKEALENGSLYKVRSGDTWYSLTANFYPDFDKDSLIQFLISINGLNNTDLPLNENIFLPSL